MQKNSVRLVGTPEGGKVKIMIDNIESGFLTFDQEKSKYLGEVMIGSAMRKFERNTLWGAKMRVEGYLNEEVNNEGRGQTAGKAGSQVGATPDRDVRSVKDRRVPQGKGKRQDNAQGQQGAA